MQAKKTVLWLVMGILVACTAADQPTTVPTLLLIPATPTITPIPPTATATLPPQPPAVNLPTAIPAYLAGLASDQERQVALAVMTDLAARLALPVSTITVTAVQAIQQTTTAADCALVTETRAAAYPGYQVILTVNAILYTYSTDGTGTMVRFCAETPVHAAHGETLLLIDPVAGEMAALAQRHLAEQLDLATPRIHLVDIQAFTWPDSSLGCPVAGQTYTTMNIDGYRLLLAVGDTEYLFHTDFNRLTPCDPANEVLP